MKNKIVLAILLVAFIKCESVSGECTYDGGCTCYLIVGPGNRRPTTNLCGVYSATTAIEPVEFEEGRDFHSAIDGMFWTDAKPGWRHIFYFKDGRGRAVRSTSSGTRLRSRGRRGGCVAYSTFDSNYKVRRCSSEFRSICLVPRPISTSIIFSATLTWQGGGPPDLDFKTINSECEIAWYNQLCTYHSSAASMELDQDEIGCCGSGETITFTGDFSAYSLKTLIYVHVYSDIGSIADSQTMFTFRETGYPDFTVTAPVPHVGQTYWLVGCVEPSLGACSFTPIQQYSFTAPTDSSICP